MNWIGLSINRLFILHSIIIAERAAKVKSLIEVIHGPLSPLCLGFPQNVLNKLSLIMLQFDLKPVVNSHFHVKIGCRGYNMDCVMGKKY